MSAYRRILIILTACFVGEEIPFCFFFLFYLKKNEINITATRPDRYEKIKQSKNAERYTEQA